MAGNIIITSAGLDLVTSAHTSGPLIALKYFLPVYDYRIDGNIHNGEAYGTSAIDISAAASYDDTEPFGEIIYNIDETSKAYDLSTNDNWVMFDGTESITSATTTWEVSASIMSKEQQINLYDGSPMKNFISGSSVEYISASSTEGYWRIENAAAVYGSNLVPSETSAGNGEFFSITDYYPVTSGGTLRGSWKCRLIKDIGKVKINKLALYAVQVDASGNETSDPVLFAEAMLNDPVVKTNLAANGFDDITFDVQIQMSTVTANFADVFYSTSGDYWSRTPGGLQYSSKVGVGVFTVDNEEPHTQLDVKGTSDIPAIGIRSNDNDNDYWIFDVPSAGDLIVSGVSGDIEIYNNIELQNGKNINISGDSNFYLEYGDINLYTRTDFIRNWKISRNDTIWGHLVLSAVNPSGKNFTLYCDDIYLSADVGIKDNLTIGGITKFYDHAKFFNYLEIADVNVSTGDYTGSSFAFLSANEVLWCRCDLTPSSLGGGEWALGSPSYKWNELYCTSAAVNDLHNDGNIINIKDVIYHTGGTIFTDILWLGATQSGVLNFYSPSLGQEYFSITNDVTNNPLLSAYSTIWFEKDLKPHDDNSYDLGDGTHRLTDIYATNGSIQTSDIRDKTKIHYLNVGLDFINDLEPKSYRWKNKDNGEHYGLIAQELIEVCKKHNLDSTDLALINTGEKLGLRYTELIAPMIRAIQELSSEVNKLKEQLNEHNS